MTELQTELQKIVYEGYKKIAPEFAATRQRGAGPKIKPFLKFFPKNGSVLDLGCGTGRLIPYLPANLDYLGVDPSSELLAIAKSSYPKHRFLKGGFLEANQWGRFSVVVSLAAWHHLPDLKSRLESLEKMAQATLPGGLVIVSVWNFWGRAERRRQLWHHFWRRPRLLGQRLSFKDLLFPWKNQQGEVVAQRYYHAFSRSEIRGVLKRLGVSRKDYDLFSDLDNHWLVWRPAKESS